jgi:hypothetical protein
MHSTLDVWLVGCSFKWLLCHSVYSLPIINCLSNRSHGKLGLCCYHVRNLQHKKILIFFNERPHNVHNFPELLIFIIIFSGSAAQRGLWPPRSRGFLITHNDAPQSVGLLWTSDQLIADTSTWQHTNIHTPRGIRTHDRSRRAAVDLHLRPRGHWDRPTSCIFNNNFPSTRRWWDSCLSFWSTNIYGGREKNWDRLVREMMLIAGEKRKFTTLMVLRRCTIFRIKLEVR